MPIIRQAAHALSVVTVTLLAAASASAATSIRVMTYNTHHGGLATSPTTTDGQLDTIKAQNPDVVVLQEAYASQLSYYVNGLNSRFATSVWHGVAAKHCKTGTQPTCTDLPGESVMILTRLTTSAIDSRLIWAADDYWVARATIHMTITLADGTPVNVFVCHLPALSDAQASRDAYVTAFQSWASTFSGTRLVGGDFNDHPGTGAINEMTTSYTDAWAAGGSGAGYTHPAATPTSRIDYWFTNSQGGAALTAVSVVADAVDSDHRPVVATYSVGSTSTAPSAPSVTETTLLDDAFTTLDRTKWPGGVFTGTQDSTIPLASSGGELQIGSLKASMTGSHYNGISSPAYNLASGGYAYVRMAKPANTATLAYTMFAAGSDSNDFYRWYESGNSLVAEKKIAGVKTTLVNLAYDATADQFLRIRNAYNSATGATEVLFETAPNNNGVPGAFTVRYQESWDARVNLTAIKFELKAGTSDAVLSPGSAWWDTFHAASTVQ
jgi:endonuclease/exonuclease/phosphatase family metal-dependent hydrolase